MLVLGFFFPLADHTCTGNLVSWRQFQKSDTLYQHSSNLKGYRLEMWWQWRESFQRGWISVHPWGPLICLNQPWYLKGQAGKTPGQEEAQSPREPQGAPEPAPSPVTEGKKMPTSTMKDVVMSESTYRCRLFFWPATSTEGWCALSSISPFSK